MGYDRAAANHKRDSGDDCRTRRASEPTATGYHGRGRSRGAARNPKVVGQRQSNGRLVVESIIEFGSGGRFQETKRLPQYFLLYLRGIRRAKRLPTRKARK